MHFVIVLAALSQDKTIMRTLLISYYPSPKPNLIECAKNNRGIKTLTVFLHALRFSVKYNPVRVINPNRVIFVTTLRACGTTIRVLMPLLFLAFSIRFGLGLG